MVTDIPSLGLRSGTLCPIHAACSSDYLGDHVVGAPPPGYLKPCPEPCGVGSKQLSGVPPFQGGARPVDKVPASFNELSSLDVFMMLRGVNPSAGAKKRPPSLDKLQSSGPNLKKLHCKRSTACLLHTTFYCCWHGNHSAAVIC